MILNKILLIIKSSNFNDSERRLFNRKNRFIFFLKNNENDYFSVILLIKYSKNINYGFTLFYINGN